jgi:sugar diacid utilization regulator
MRAVNNDDLGSMQRAVLSPDGISSLLRWLARRFDGHAALVGTDGKPARMSPAFPDGILKEAYGDIRRVTAGDLDSASIDGKSWWARVTSVAAAGETGGSPALIVASGTPLSADDGTLVAHAAALAGLRHSADERGRAITHLRESVLHLLMASKIAAATQVAQAMKPALAAVIRVYIVEGPPGARNALADRCQKAVGGTAWVVRCPVYRRHVIILAPADDSGQDGNLMDTLRSAAGWGDAAIGAGGTASLADTASAYEQAYHALAVARHRHDRFSSYTSAGDLEAVLPPAAGHWARRELAPLLEYMPTRQNDPDSDDLQATLRSWLDFRGAAWRQLKINRTTLDRRLKHIEDILGRGLQSSLAAQAEIRLALQLLHRPGSTAGGAVPELPELLAAPAALEWAQMTLAPLDHDQVLRDTVRAWLAAGASTELAAASMQNISSDRGVRRRLRRAEVRLGKSLLGGPSYRHDLLMAFRILEGTPGEW